MSCQQESDVLDKEAIELSTKLTGKKTYQLLCGALVRIQSEHY